MIRPGGRVLATIGIVVLALGALLSASAGAASPPSEPGSLIERQDDICTGAGTWQMHFLLKNNDSAPINATLTVDGVGAHAFSPNPIPVSQTAHWYFDIPAGWTNGRAEIDITWATAEGTLHKATSQIGLQHSGTCPTGQPTIPTAPPNTTPPKPGATTTVPARPGATTTVPADPNASTTTSALAQTNGVDPVSGVGVSTTTVDPTTDTSPDSVELAATTAATKPSSSSGAIWVVVGIFLAAAVGGAVLLFLTRRSAGSDDATPIDP